MKQLKQDIFLHEADEAGYIYICMKQLKQDIFVHEAVEAGYICI